MRFQDVIARFPTEESAIKHYYSVEHPAGVVCNRCQSDKVYQENARPKVFYCMNCKSSFSPFKGTIYEKSSTDIRKWMYAVHVYLKRRGGITAKQLQREIGVTYKTAWRMLRKIKELDAEDGRT